MTITDFNHDSSYLPDLTCNMDVRAHIGRLTGRSTPYPPILASNGQEWQFYISIVRVYIGRSTGRSTPPSTGISWSRMAITFLLLEFILADQLADLPPHWPQISGTPLHWISVTYRRMHIYPWQTYPPNQLQVYRALLHQTSRTYWEMRRTSPASQPQVYRALLHQTSITYWEMRRFSPANWPQVYRALLHQTSITYWEMRRPSPTNWPQVYRALLHHISRTYSEIQTYPVQMDDPPLIYPKSTAPYYTKPV